MKLINSAKGFPLTVILFVKNVMKIAKNSLLTLLWTWNLKQLELSSLGCVLCIQK